MNVAYVVIKVYGMNKKDGAFRKGGAEGLSFTSGVKIDSVHFDKKRAIVRKKELATDKRFKHGERHVFYRKVEQPVEIS